MRSQTKLHLQQLQSPAPEEWLQWIFIPRMSALLESRADLPSQIAISPYLEGSI